MTAIDILSILRQSVNSGDFTHTTTTTCGEKKVTHFPWSSGMASMHWRGQYKSKFNEPVPLWINDENPVHINGLCRLAIEGNTKLPSKKPL